MASPSCPIDARTLIGYGSQAKVFLVRHPRTGKEYALKESLDIQDPRLASEAMCLQKIARFEHPGTNHIVKYIQFFETPRFCLVLEYLPLGMLSSHLRSLRSSKKELSEMECCRLLCQMASALVCVHALGLVHCDINPNNVLLHSIKPFHAKLADFGLARETNSFLRGHCGTDRYIAPEVYGENIRQYGEAADIWSLGVLVFDCAAGFPPGLRPGSQETILECVRVALGYIRYPVLALVSRGMIVESPQERYSAVRCEEEARNLFLVEE